MRRNVRKSDILLPFSLDQTAFRTIPMRARNSRLKPNDPCPCGTGVKFKHCCRDKPTPDAQQQVVRRALANIAITYTARDVYGRNLSWEEAKTELKKLNVKCALGSMGMLNGVSAEFQRVELKGVDGLKRLGPLLEYLLPQEHRKAALLVYRDHQAQAFQPLSAQACIAMTEACARYCDREGGIMFDQPHEVTAFAHVLFSYQGNLVKDGLFPPGYKVAALTPEQFSSFTRGYQAANFVTDLQGGLVRFFMQFQSDEIVARLKMSPAKWFKQVTGISPELYCQLLMFFMHIGGEFSLDKPDLERLMYNLDTVLADVAPAPAMAFTHLVRTAEIDYAELDKTKEPADWDEAVFASNYIRRRPAWRVVNGYSMQIHRQVMLEKFFVGVGHLLTDLVAVHPQPGADPDRSARVSQLRIDLGYIFDDYVPRLLRVYFAGAKQWYGYEGPKKAERDGLVIAGDIVLVFEYVHHPWSLADRAKGTVEIYAKHLKDNLLKVAGVASAIVERKFMATELPKDFHVVPVVVLSEAVPVSELIAETFINGLVNLEGCEECVRGKDNVLPVQLLSLVQLENLDRIVPASAGALGVARFLRDRARRELKRVTGEPAMGMPLADRPDRFAYVEAVMDKMFEEQVPKLFVTKSETPKLN